MLRSGQASLPARAGWSGRRRQPRQAAQCKMHVPTGDTFGGKSPEFKAAEALQKLFTFVAARIVLSQLEGSGRGALAAYNPGSYEVLSSHLLNVPITDSEAWLAELCRRNEMLGVRVMEVRAAYSKDDFEWSYLHKLTTAGVEGSNVKLMRAQVERRLAQQLAGEPQAQGQQGQQQQPGEPQ